jgi:hypothetical protein
VTVEKCWSARVPNLFNRGTVQGCSRCTWRPPATPRWTWCLRYSCGGVAGVDRERGKAIADPRSRREAGLGDSRFCSKQERLKELVVLVSLVSPA